MTRLWLQKTKALVKTMKLPPHAVGHHLIFDVPVAFSGETVYEVKSRLLSQLDKYKSVNYVYVLSKNYVLKGVFSFSEVFISPPDSRIKNLVTTTLVYSHPPVDRERVAHLALKHNIKSVPIVDEKMRFLGIIPSDQIHKILYEEHKEDMLKSVGIITYSTAIDDSLDSSVVQAFIRRVPWIMLGTIGGLLLAGIIGVFENTLKDNLVLAAFIPLVVYVSAAVGAQTQILFIRDLALNGKMSILSYALKQMFTTFLIAVTSGIFITVIVAVFWQTYYLGLIIGLAATASIIFSVLIAMLVPYLLNTYKQDPANGSGPFATIIQDAASVVIYFAIASFLL